MLTLTVWQVAFGQSRVITGTVSDEMGPIPGVQVYLKETATGTITDFMGGFSLDVSSTTDPVLVFSFIGYETQEVRVGDRTALDVTLAEDVKQLEEVVVIGYGVTQKSDLTGAVAVIDSEELAKFPVTNTATALQGRASGVFVGASAEPGASPNINIRGVGSISGNSTPLYVVDGIQTTDIAGINPQDIESLQVLKDASAAAIYGSRAANGVIIITTKSGENGATKISLSVETGISQVAKRYEMMDTETYAAYTRDLYVNASSDLVTLTPPAWVDDAALLAINTDWQQEALEQGQVVKSDMAISGGGEHGNYRLSLGYISQSGAIRDTDYQRFNLGFKGQMSKGIFTVGQSTNAYKARKHKSPLTTFSNSIYQAAPQMPVYDASNLNGLGAPTATTTGGNNEPNPLAAHLFDNFTDTYGALTNLYTELQLAEVLTFRTDFNLTFSQEADDFYTPVIDQGSAAFLNSPQTRLITASRQALSYNVESYFRYQQFWGKHNFSAMAGASAKKDVNTGTSISAVDIEIGTRVPQTGTVLNASGSNRAYTLQSLLGRVNYSFDDKYLFTGSLRYDGSSRFAKDIRWHLFPSLSAGWRISAEDFMTGAAFISNLKLRAGYGELGRQIGNAQPVLNAQIVYPFPEGGFAGVAPIELPNANLTWETVRQTNVGLDMGLFQDQVTITAEYFIRNSENMLLEMANAGYSGVRGSTWVNAGALTNSGWEAEVAFVDDLKNGFHHRISGNITMIQNKITSLPSVYANGVVQASSILKEGQPIGAYYGYLRDEINPITGTQKFQDIDGDRTVDGNDRTVLGSPHPTYFLGLNYTASYKAFDFTLFVQGAGGHQLYNINKRLLESTGSFNNRLAYVRDEAWSESNPDGSLPIISLKNASSHSGIDNDAMSDRWVENADYIRIKNLQVGYTLHGNALQKLGLNRCRLYVSGLDLLTISSYSGLDPTNVQANSGSFLIGYDRSPYHPLRTYMAGLQLSF